MEIAAAQIARALASLVSDVSLKTGQWAYEQDMTAPAVETFAGAEAKTYEDVGISTTENGLVIELPNGAQFEMVVRPVGLGRTI